MTGETESKQVDYVTKKFDEIVEKIEKQAELFGLQKVETDVTCSTYFNMSEDEISRLSQEELALAEVKLSCYAFSIQKYANIASTLRNWAERSLGLVVAKEYETFDKFMKYEVRRDLVISSNNYASRLNSIISQQQIIVDEFMYLAQSIQHVSDSFGKLARIKRKERE